jgi:hypothetical protein
LISAERPLLGIEKAQFNFVITSGKTEDLHLNVSARGQKSLRAYELGLILESDNAAVPICPSFCIVQASHLRIREHGFFGGVLK